MKKLLIILGILVLLVIGVLFVPPIYNRFTKPFFKNTVDAKEWYHQVDCENLTQVRDYCDRRGYSTDYYILVDFSKPSGKKRFFIYDLQRGIRVMSSYCTTEVVKEIRLPNQSSAILLEVDARVLEDMSR